MVRQINASVGLNGRNLGPDVRTVQELINGVPSGLGGPPKPIAVDGFIGPETVGAIHRFQNKNFGWGDGRVDPQGKTLGKLNDYVELLSDPSIPVQKLLSPDGSPRSLTPNQAAGGEIDTGGLGFRGLAGLDSHAYVAGVSGAAFANSYPVAGPAYLGLILNLGGMVWTGKGSTAIVKMVPSGRIVQVPPVSMYFVGNQGPVPLNQVQYYKSSPPAGPVAPYYQVGKTTPAPNGPAQKPAPYTSKGPGVSPGYFNQ